ncbi:MAG: peptidoglycan-binding protein [Candidatus Yonathbacteria bacterium]|nr:peptidoglycan-binding protein [Candidatus Yonathbacteria bacterium]
MSTQSKFSKLVAGFVGLSTALMLIGTASVAEAAALTQSQINAIVSLLQSFGADAQTIANVQSSLTGGTPSGSTTTTTTTTSTSCAFTFSKNLKQGMTGTDVMNLQKALNANSATQVAATGVGSAGNESSYFGPATAKAVVKFQELYAADILTPAGLKAGNGFVGAGTRAKLNALCSTSGTTTTTTTGPVAAVLATTNPASQTIVAKQATANLMEVTFSGNGIVTGVELQRTGISADTTLTSVYLYEGNTRLTDAASVISGGVIRFANPTGLFTVSGSKTVSVRADIASSTAGQTVGVKLNNYTVAGATSATVSGLMGNIMSVASTDVASVSNSATNSVTGSPTVDAGSSNYTVWGNTLTISTRAVALKGANFKFVGSAPVDSLQNVRLIVDGAAVGSASSVNALGNIAFDLSSAPVTLATGAHTIEVHADVVNGANRSFYLSLQNAGDLMLTDSQLGVNVAMVTAPSTTTFSIDNGASITINQGTLSFQLDPTFTTTNVTGGSSNATIAKYTLKAFGESVKVMQLQVTPVTTTTTASGTDFQNVTLFVNGGQVGTSQNWTSGALTYNLGSSLIVPANQNVTLEVRADLRNATGANHVNGNIYATTVIPANQAQGLTSLALYPSSAMSQTSNSLAMGSASVTIAKSSSLADSSSSSNVSNVKIGSYVIQAGSTEGVRVTNLNLDINGTLTTANVSNLKTSENATPVNPQSTNNFSVDFTVAAGQSKTIDIFADLGNSTGTVQTDLLVTARGASSNTVLTTGAGIASEVTGQTITVGSGNLAVPTAIQSTSPVAQYVEGNTTGQKIAVYNFTSSTGDSTIQEMTFSLGGTANAASKVTVTAGAQSCSAPVVGTSATLTGCNITVPKGYGGKDVTVTVDLNTVGLGGLSSASTVSATLTYVKASTGNVITQTNATSTFTLTGSSDLSVATGATGTGKTVLVASTTPFAVGQTITIEAGAADIVGVITAKVSATELTVTISQLGTTPANAATVTGSMSVASNTLTMVASQPTLTIGDYSTAKITNTQTGIARVTVKAGNNGAIRLNALPISVSTTGTATNVTTAAVLVKEGTTSITTTDTLAAVGAGSTGTGVVTFTGGQIIPAGSSRIFDIYLTVAGAADTGDSVSVQLSPASSLSWDDIEGNGSTLAGTLINSFPTGDSGSRSI